MRHYTSRKQRSHVVHRIARRPSRKYGPNPATQLRAHRSNSKNSWSGRLGYLRAGYPINLAGPAGTGKTTLALHLAARLRQPVTLIHGDDEFGSSDLVGNDHGYRKSKLIDNFIHSVVKTEETMKTLWTDNRLTTACRFGHVLIYDEFTRSRPEANNVLLSVLGERLLNLPKKCNGGDGYLEVHPDFRAIFTSNPQEYAGVHKSQDALLDRLITIYMDHYDRDTEVAITASSGGVSAEMAEQIVDLVHFFRKRDPSGQHPEHPGSDHDRAGSWRCQGLACDPANPLVLSTCRDVLHIGNPCGRAKDLAPSLDELHARSAPGASGAAARTRPRPRPWSRALAGRPRAPAAAADEVLV